MALLLVTISGTVLAQKDSSYTAEWKQVAALEKKGLTASALKAVVGIYQRAKKDGNETQQIKSSIYQIRYRGMTEENSQENNIDFVDSLAKHALSPAKNILLSMEAEMYWHYLQNNRWKLYNRTQLSNDSSSDISTWTLNKLYRTIGGLYEASLQEKEQLQHSRLDGFDDILVKGKNTRNLRPTLYDFLAFRALDYFKTGESELTKPAYRFVLKEPAAFAPVEEFVQYPFATEDSSATQYNALVLLQQIEQFHLTDERKEALLDADLIRLSFVYAQSVNPDKMNLYENALLNLEETFPRYEATAQAMYLRAALYNQKGQNYDPVTNTTNQYEIKRAWELCEAAIKKFPGSEGSINAQNLLNQVLRPSLTLETEKVNVPGQPFRTLVKYKNVQKVYFRIIKTNRGELKNADRRDYNKLWQSYAALKPLRNWSIALPDPLDYQDHSVEVKVDALGIGVYIILASLDEDFGLEKNILVRQITYVSNISFIHNDQNDYYVLNRNSGEPLAGSKIQVWQSTYDYNKGNYIDIKAEQYSSDKNGFFKMKKIKDYRQVQLQVTYGPDELFMDENIPDYHYNYYEPAGAVLQTFLFTDRSIYRPGQTVYFKGIVLNKTGKAVESKVVSGHSSTIQLMDANRQKVGELKVTTNEFGSYHGSFKIPEEGVTGQFSLYDSACNGNSYFSVEEYKRPKFFTEIQKPAGTYRVNDSIVVTGFAKAYAGNNIDGAAVKYRVVRKLSYPVWWGYRNTYSRYRPIYPPGRNEQVEIINGNTVTDASGKFHIVFKAIPDETTDKKDQPTFYFEVSADVTDLNGETRSGQTEIAVAYQALQLQITSKEKMNADSLYRLPVSSTNLNDIFEKTAVAVHLYKLREPGRIFRERYWQVPDQFVMSRDEYYRYFPFDVYKDEDKVSNWQAGNAVLEVNDSTSERLFINLPIRKGTAEGKLLPGWYKVVVTAKDKYGEDVRAEKYIELTGDKNRPSVPVIVETKIATAEPGGNIRYTIKTGFEKIWLIHSLTRMDSSVAVQYLNIAPTNGFDNTLAVQESDRGGIGMSYAFVKHNRAYSGKENFQVPWTNKELTITYASFRDKLLPGGEEKWTVKISGSKGEKVSAEMLAAMYDASLDQFRQHGWGRLNIWPGLFNVPAWSHNSFNSQSADLHPGNFDVNTGNLVKSYDQLLNFRENYLQDVVVVGYGRKDATLYRMTSGAPGAAADVSEREMGDFNEDTVKHMKLSKPGFDDTDADGVPDNIDREPNTPKGNKVDANGVTIQEGADENPVRKNFNETAFFFPDLTTDEEGNVSFRSTLPEALTQWKLMTLVHTKDLKSGYAEKTLVTQKPLMVQPNAPRFMRESDQLEFSVKVVNLSDSALEGTASLQLMDAADNKLVNELFGNQSTIQKFTVGAGQSTVLKYPLKIPLNFNSALTYRVIATAGDFSDGEEMVVPVLTNRTLVTESLPLNMRNTAKKDFRFEKLISSANSHSISNHALTVEYTSNPAWYAVQALPYLMEYPYECAEQTFNRYYANTLASYITNSSEKIKAVFEKWKTADTAALLSNLQKNEELKSLLLQETPWVLDARDETQQKKNIALLFDMVRMSNETGKALAKLKEMQSSNGGFTWFKGGPDDRYMTQYILTGIGHLKKLQALAANDQQQANDLNAMVQIAIPYLDSKMKDDYEWLVKHKANLKENNLNYSIIQYLYMRGFFTNIAVSEKCNTAFAYYRKQAQQYWLSNSRYMQAMIALALDQWDDHKTPPLIIRSLKENAINNDETGMYWKDWNNRGWFWYQAPIESQALMIEAFAAIDKNTARVDDLKTWLLKQKQTQNWGTTRATAEACYALLLTGSSWLQQEPTINIRLGNTVVKSTDQPAEAGTGYFKKRIEGNTVTPAMGNITVSTDGNSKNVSGWGAVYWQYFEDLDKITAAATPLSLQKKLYLERNTDKGPVLDALEDGARLKVGDKIKVRIILKVDRDMEYVQMKDMRASCMEPVNVLSGYKYQGGLGYYESTRDASTNFFFNWLNKGTYVFEYPVFVTHAGNFSNGITSIQCMYAPEFTSHSEGIRVEVLAL